MKNGNFVSAIECWLYKLALKLKIVRSSKNVGIKCQQWHKLHVCQLCRTLACLNRWLLSLLFPVWIDRDKVEDNLGPTWGSNSSCYIKISFQWHIAPYTHTLYELIREQNSKKILVCTQVIKNYIDLWKQKIVSATVWKVGILATSGI